MDTDQQQVRRRTGGDVILGILLVIVGLVILGYPVIATVLSVRFLGWTALIIGLVELFGALFRIRAGHFWSTALGGVLLAVLGLLILRNTAAAALTLTLAAGALFLASGIVRVAVSFAQPEHRWGLLIGGIASTILGLIVLFNIVAATSTLLGVLLGVQVLVEGVTILLLGRMDLRGGSVDARGLPEAAEDGRGQR